jgi:glycine/D-amino acid oxidase-like deaminating enzyme
MGKEKKMNIISRFFNIITGAPVVLRTCWLQFGVLLALSLPISFPTLCWADDSQLYDTNDSYWSQFLPPINPALDKDLSVDVAVIGGGYTGLSAAYHIKKSNPALKVVLIEARRVGNGASGRNGGLVLAQTYSEGGFCMGKNKAHHKEIYDITVASMKRLRALAESSGIDPEYVLNGHCAGIFNPDNLDHMRKYVAKARKLGMPIEFWEQDKAISMLGSPGLLGAVYDPNGGMVNPAKLVAALKKLAEDAGVVIYENSPVESFTRGKTLVLKVGDDDQPYEIKARSMVIAANAYAAATLDFLTNDIEPCHTQVAVSEPLTEEQYQSLGWKDHISWYDDQYVGKDGDATFHMIMTRDRRIVIGGGSVEYNYDDRLLYPGNLKKIEAQIAQRLSELYPSLKNVRLENTWDGIICETKSKSERIGVTGKHHNIYYALGYNGGQGVNVAFLFGELVSKLYDGKHKLLKIYTK